jgi:hypothetical protein
MMASAGYFEALGIRLEEGRQFTPADTGAAPVIAVSRSWAHHYFPEGNVIGRRLIQGGCVTCPLTTVVAEVGDVKYAGLDAPPDAVYSPITEDWTFARSIVLFVRTVSSPGLAASSIRAALRSVDPGLPLDDISSLDEQVTRSLAPPRQLASLVGGFAVAALLLAAIGIFGMLSYTVSARRREIGVRMALGAKRSTVVGMVLRGGMMRAAIGAVLGVVVTLLCIGRLSRALFEVRPTDPVTLVSAIAVLLVVALVACTLPALRAARADPLEAIRGD